MPPQPPPISSEKPSFSKTNRSSFSLIIEDEKELERLRDFMETERNGETLSFYFAVLDFMNIVKTYVERDQKVYFHISPNTIKTILLESQKLYAQYISDESQTQVNIPQKIKDKIMRASELDNNGDIILQFQEDNVDLRELILAFGTAMIYIKKLIKTDVLPRYVRKYGLPVVKSVSNHDVLVTSTDDQESKSPTKKSRVDKILRRTGSSPSLLTTLTTTISPTTTTSTTLDSPNKRHLHDMLDNDDFFDITKISNYFKDKQKATTGSMAISKSKHKNSLCLTTYENDSSFNKLAESRQTSSSLGLPVTKSLLEDTAPQAERHDSLTSFIFRSSSFKNASRLFGNSSSASSTAPNSTTVSPLTTPTLTPRTSFQEVITFDLDHTCDLQDENPSNTTEDKNLPLTRTRSNNLIRVNPLKSCDKKSSNCNVKRGSGKRSSLNNMTLAAWKSDKNERRKLGITTVNSNTATDTNTNSNTNTYTNTRNNSKTKVTNQNNTNSTVSNMNNYNSDNDDEEDFFDSDYFQRELTHSMSESNIDIDHRVSTEVIA
eukprot:Awhi_evm1s12797